MVEVRYDLCQADKICPGINILWCQCEQRGCAGCAFSGLNKMGKEKTGM